MNGKSIMVSNTHELQNSLVVTGFGYEHDEAWLANIGLFQEFTDVTRGVRRLGSAAIDMCHVACGAYGFILICIISTEWYYCIKFIVMVTSFKN
jgi:fructose-1,6-bisphosphatase/inositol monophosphatase family enzyme